MPAHARQVVLELSELDLELPLGRDGVLGEDVEDQLGAVDDASGKCILERSLLDGIELVVDEQHLRAMIRVRGLQLLELPLADVAAGVGVRAALDRLRDRLDPGGARELAQLAELAFRVGSLGQHSEQQPALWLRAVPELGLACRHRPKYAPLFVRKAGIRRSGFPAARIPRLRRRQIPEGVACGAATTVAGAKRRGGGRLAAVGTLADRLAERTLELVDIPSESLHEAEVRDTLRAAVPRGVRRGVRRRRGVSLGARRDGSASRCSCSPATTTPSPPRGTSPVASRTAPCTAAARAT